MTMTYSKEGERRIEFTKSAQTKMKLSKIYKAAASVAYDDIFRNRWKIPFYLMPFGVGTTTILMTMAYYGLSNSEMAQEGRERIKKAASQTPQADLYDDFVKVSVKDPHKMDVSTFDMVKYLVGWNYRYVKSKMYNNGFLKRKPAVQMTTGSAQSFVMA